MRDRERGHDFDNAPGCAPEGRRAHADPRQQRVRLGLVVRAAHGLGAGDEHGHRKPLAARREAGQVVRGLRQDDVDPLALDDLEQRVGVARVRARRHEVEGVAEATADRALRHVDADETHLAFAVVAQPSQERRRAGRARGADEDRRHASTRTPSSSSR